MPTSFKDQIKWAHLDESAPSPDYDNFPFASRRSVVWGTKGMATSSQPLASEAALEILRKGGNAADAAVAGAAALNVTEPGSCGLGGDLFCLYWNAKDKSLKGLNASGRSPKALTLQKARELGIKGKEIPLSSPHSVTVPGAPAGFVDTIESFGSGKLSLAQVLEPAIRLAEEGCPISEISASQWQRSEKLIKRQSPNGDEMLVDGRAPHVGEIFTNPTLAQTMRALGKDGKKGYYEGRIAEAIVRVLSDKGGVMTLEDLASHKSEFVEPISYTYHDSFTLHECPPNGQGLTPLIALGIIEQMQELGLVDLAKVEYNGTEYCHAVIEALRLAFADTRAYIADMQHGHVPIKELLSKEYLQSRAKLFNPKAATADVRKGTPLASSDTVYLTTADKDGNACSFIFSNYAGYGTAIVPKGCGFTLQNRGGGFTLEEGHPNCLAGGKRPYHTIIPAMVTKDNELFMAYGVMGGFMQPQGHLQVLLNMLHQGFHPQNALDAPRLCISAGMPDATDENSAGDINSEVFFEEGISPKVVEELGKMGHNVGSVSGAARGMFGRGQIIQRKVDTRSGRTVWAAGSDPRADGHAVAQI